MIRSQDCKTVLFRGDFDCLGPPVERFKNGLLWNFENSLRKEYEFRELQILC